MSAKKILSIVSIFLAVLMAVSFMSCDKEPSERDPLFNPVLAAELKQSPSELIVAGNVLVLETFLWRDFMPISPEDGKPLISINKLLDGNAAEVSSQLTLTRQHVVFEDLVWSTAYDEITTYDPLALEGISRNGPKWGPDVFVDVVCEFTFQGATFFIIARNQEISATF